VSGSRVPITPVLSVAHAGLAEWSPIRCTYAGGARHMQDLELVDRLSGGKIDLTFGR
jgi:phosphoribosylformimino-5-aminoimidazole carboxamide ribonucleotide (ProFAR) isomerase